VSILNQKTLNLSLPQLREFAFELASKLKPSTVILLQGPVGAGKTQLSKFLVEALTGNKDAHSPSYSLINEYKGAKFPIFHIDLYRIKNLNDLDSTGVWDVFQTPGLVIVEWADLIEESAFPIHWNKIKLVFEPDPKNANIRKVSIF